MTNRYLKMIILHHLNQSRSIRILRLLEEIGMPYEIKRYQRQPQDFLAPPELKAVHPLGKSPILEVDDLKIAESGAIVEFLICRYAPNLAPEAHSPEYGQYLQWIHFAESSLMLPLLLNIFCSKETAPLNFLPQYATAETEKVLHYLDDCLAGKTYILGEQLSGADFMLSSVVDILTKRNMLITYPNIKQYGEHLASLPSWQRADKIEQEN